MGHPVFATPHDNLIGYTTYPSGQLGFVVLVNGPQQPVVECLAG